jgi:release factor glutamine methyltransferase
MIQHGGATVAEALRQAAETFARHGFDQPALNAEQLLCHILSCRRTDLFIQATRRVDRDALLAFQRSIGQRLGHVPLQYITGSARFLTFELSVAPGVFIPRPETEILVDEAIRRIQTHPHDNGAEVLIDLGTGSGNIAIALALAFPQARVYATDLSEKALRVARENAGEQRCQERIHFLRGDLFEPFAADQATEPATAIICNPPYIVRADIEALPPEVRDYEPRLALDGGPDGLDIVRRVVRESAAHLKVNGYLALEVGQGQAAQVKTLLRQEGHYGEIKVVKDLAGIDRVVLARHQGTH